MRTHTWLILLVIFIAFDHIKSKEKDDQKSAETDMQTVAEAVLKFIRRSNDNPNRKNHVSHVQHHKQHHKDKKAADKQGVDVFLNNGSLCFGIDEDDRKGHGLSACFNISKLFKDSPKKNKNKDDQLGNTRKRVNSKHKATPVSQPEPEELEDYSYENDPSDVEYVADDESNCGVFGCGKDDSWRTAPERVWQGVKSGLEDWAVGGSSVKARSVAVGKPYSDKIFGSSFF